jgi:hypothetical protein
MDHFAELMSLVKDGWRVESDKEAPHHCRAVRFIYRNDQVCSGFFVDDREVNCSSKEAFGAECKRHFEAMVRKGTFRSGVEMARKRFGDTWGALNGD